MEQHPWDHHELLPSSNRPMTSLLDNTISMAIFNAFLNGPWKNLGMVFITSARSAWRSDSLESELGLDP